VQVVFRRFGTARRLDVDIDGRMLSWKEDESLPLEVDGGQHLVQWLVEGTTGDTFGLRVVSPPTSSLSVTGDLESDQEQGSVVAAF
jgi:hypothetical protein